MERLMATETYLYQGEYAQSLIARGEAKGKAEGEARAVLTLLDFRDVALSEEDRARIMATTDLAVLERWIQRASFVNTVEELFA
jgi:hypothetical protein